MIGDVLLECALGRARRSPASRTTPGRTILDEGAEPLGRVVAGFGNDGESGFEGCRYRRASTARTCTARCCRATRGSPTALLAEALAHAGGDRRARRRSPDELEREAHDVAAQRARARGGRR